MIELNMMKQRPTLRGIPSEKDGAKLLIFVLLAVLIGALLAVGILRTVASLTGDDTAEKRFTNVDVTVKSTAVLSGDLKDSVDGALVPKDRLTSYENMSMLEQLNYEHAFAYYLFRELSLIVPPDVDFNELGFTNYSKVQAEGGVDSKSSVVSLFSSLKVGGWSLEPLPASRFRFVDESYQFQFRGEYRIKPSALDADMISEKDIPAADHLQRLKDSVAVVVNRMPVVSNGKMDLLDTKFEGKFRHYTYTISGKSSFTQFRELLNGIRLLRLPVSISDVKLSAYEGGLTWKLTVKITVI